jgi:hypothetical protein
VRRVRDFHADRAEANDAERAARQFIADEFLLALLDRAIEFFVAALQFAGVIPRLADISRREKQARDHQFLHRVGIGAGSVEYGYAALGQARHWNIVGARAGAPDGDDTGGKIHRVHVRRADQDRVGIAYRRGDFITLARQPFQAAHGHVVESEDSISHMTLK